MDTFNKPTTDFTIPWDIIIIIYTPESCFLNIFKLHEMSNVNYEILERSLQKNPQIFHSFLFINICGTNMFFLISPPFIDIE